MHPSRKEMLQLEKKCVMEQRGTKSLWNTRSEGDEPRAPVMCSRSTTEPGWGGKRVIGIEIWNCNGLRGRLKDGSLEKFLGGTRADIVALLEVKCTAEDINKLQNWKDMLVGTGFVAAVGHFSGGEAKGTG